MDDESHGITPAQLRNLSGEDLFRYVQLGHQDAFAILFERYHRLVLEIALKVLRDRSEAEDLMQSVFFEIYRCSAQFDPARGTVKTWIALYAYHRSLGRRRYLNVRSVLTEQETDGRVEQDFALPARFAADGLTELEQRRLVEQGLATLNDQQRETLKLAFYEGFSMAEIADRRNESIVNVRHHYYRGLRKLRALLYGGSSDEIRRRREKPEERK